jgi:hypothetical protein
VSEVWAIFWGTLGATGLMQAVIAAFVYGKLTQAVKNHDVSIEKLWKRGDGFEETLSRHGERISKLEGYRL